MPMLEIEALNAFRGPAHVLRGLSLSVEDGETICLVGRNGAGKSTTLESIMGTRAVPVSLLRATTMRCV